MQSLGGILFLLGTGSFVVGMIGMDFRLLRLLDMWGESTGTIIRIGMIVLGVVLFVAGSMHDADADAEADEDLSRDANRYL